MILNVLLMHASNHQKEPQCHSCSVVFPFMKAEICGRCIQLTKSTTSNGMTHNYIFCSDFYQHLAFLIDLHSFPQTLRPLPLKMFHLLLWVYWNEGLKFIQVLQNTV